MNLSKVLEIWIIELPITISINQYIKYTNYQIYLLRYEYQPTGVSVVTSSSPHAQIWPQGPCIKVYVVDGWWWYALKHHYYSVSGHFELLASLSIFHYKKVIYLSFWSPVPEDVWRWVWLGQTGELDGLTQRACLGSWYRHMARTIWQNRKHHFVIEHRSQITNWRHNKLDVFLWQGRWWIGGMQAITEGAFKCQV